MARWSNGRLPDSAVWLRSRERRCKSGVYREEDEAPARHATFDGQGSVDLPQTCVALEVAHQAASIGSEVLAASLGWPRHKTRACSGMPGRVSPPAGMLPSRMLTRTQVARRLGKSLATVRRLEGGSALSTHGRERRPPVRRSRGRAARAPPAGPACASRKGAERH